MPARVGTSILGLWLCLSAMVWPHNAARGFNDVVVGLVLVLSSFSGLWIRALRFFDGLLGLWMVLSFFVLNSQTFLESLHDGLLGLLVVVLAGIPGPDAAANLDHWVSHFDENPELERRSLFQQEVEG